MFENTVQSKANNTLKWIFWIVKPQTKKGENKFSAPRNVAMEMAPIDQFHTWGGERHLLRQGISLVEFKGQTQHCESVFRNELVTNYDVSELM